MLFPVPLGLARVRAWVWVSQMWVLRHFCGPAGQLSPAVCACVCRRGCISVPVGVCFLSPEPPDRLHWNPVVTEQGVSFHSSRFKKKKKERNLLGISEQVETRRWRELPSP